MAGATLEFDATAALAVINEVAQAMGRPEPLLLDIGEYLMIAHDQRFASQTSPEGTPWQALSPRYQRRKRKNGDKILVLDGYLKNTLRYQVNGDELLFGSNRPYAAIHQFGGTIRPKKGKALAFGGRFVQSVTIPARPYLGISEQDNKEIREIIKDWVLEQQGD